jgi:NTE family protein
MTVQDFTLNSQVPSILRELRTDGIPDRLYSDIVDGEGLQYVDLVQEGGGVLGIALVGYTYVLEQMGIRFYSLAGTSAGAINTMLLAAMGSPSEPKSTKVLRILADQDLYAFVDGPRYARKVVERAIEGKGLRYNPIWGVRLYRTYRYLKKTLGLNPGTTFHAWIRQVLNDADVGTTEALLNRREALPASLFVRGRDGPRPLERRPPPETVVIAAEISTESRIKFPEMRSLFWEEPDQVHPADYVRASMSIPGFFQPMKVPISPKTEALMDQWDETVRFTGPLPDEAVFVDGGIMSNFPIDVFHANRVPRRPTFGVKLGDDRNVPKTVQGLGQLAGATFNSARHVLDYEFLLQNRDFEHLIAHVDVGPHNWLNFDLSDEDKVNLFERGARTAAAFLRTFDWAGYKDIRRGLLTEQDAGPRPRIAVPPGNGA